MSRGYFGLAIYEPKNSNNWGSLVRTANLLGCSFIASIGRKFPMQPSDTRKTHRHIPVHEFATFEDFKKFMPIDCSLVGIELDERSKDLKEFVHPERAVYLLGAEDIGLPKDVMDQCGSLVKLYGEHSMNVSCAGSIVLYHRKAL
jgi:tRNA G18 (ribose-2'-O)-methylase SpoU